jgi:hypothetical protein
VNRTVNVWSTNLETATNSPASSSWISIDVALLSKSGQPVGTTVRRDDVTMSTLNLTIRPEFFRLPARGVDPHFGLSRAFYYSLDVTGQVRLVRLRKRGSQKGVTLVSYDAMSAFLARAAIPPSTSNPSLTDVPPSRPTPATGNIYQVVQQHSEEVELMRKLTPTLLHDLVRRISDLEGMVRAASHSA